MWSLPEFFFKKLRFLQALEQLEFIPLDNTLIVDQKMLFT